MLLMFFRQLHLKTIDTTERQQEYEKWLADMKIYGMTQHEYI